MCIRDRNQSEAPVNLAEDTTLDEATVSRLLELGISRRGFLSFCTGMASLMALPQAMIPKLAAAATAPMKPSVVYMSFQECTGCLESLVNSFAFRGGATIDNLILNMISLDYQETLMAAAGDQAEEQLSTVTGKPGCWLGVDGFEQRVNDKSWDKEAPDQCARVSANSRGHYRSHPVLPSQRNAQSG